MDRKTLIRQAALTAGKIIKSSDPSEGIVQKEGRGNFVTAADFASEKIIIDLITQYFPEDTILSEETESNIQDLPAARQGILAVDQLWVIDPIDGTNNFRFGRNYSCVSIGYVEKGIVLLGAVYNPFVDELFFAEKGKGGSVNHKKIAVSRQADIHEAVVATDNSYFPEIGERHLHMLLAIQPTPFIMMKGSAALALCEVAAGKMDLYFHTNIKPWDSAGAYLIVEEAGGSIKSFEGHSTPFTSPEIIVGNETLIHEFLNIINKKNPVQM